MSRITIISTNEFDAFAGSEVLWAEMALRLAEQGSEVTVLRPPWDEMPERTRRADRHPGIKVTEVQTRLSLAGRMGARLGVMDVARAFKQMRRRCLRDARPELVVISQGGLVDGVAWMECCAELGIPFATVVHLVADALWPDTVMAGRAAAVYPRSGGTFFVSRHNRELAARQIGHDFRDAALVRNPYNVSYDCQPLWPEDDGTWKLACVGRLGAEHKGQDLLIEVLSMPKWKERPLEVTLYGKGHHQRLLERQIADSGGARVRFGGYMDSLQDLWASQHGLIMPSRYEGLPIAMVEAMLCHRMAIATDVGGNAELIDEGRTGFLAPAAKVAAVDEALERAWQNRGKWRQMGIDAGLAVREVVPADPVGEWLSVLIPLSCHD